MNHIRGAQQQGRASGMQQEMVIVDPRWVGVPNAPGSWPPPTGDPTQNYATTKIGNAAGFAFPGPPTLTGTLTSGTSYTALPISPLAAPLAQGQVVVLVSGGSGGLVQGWTVGSGGAVAGATSIPVVSQQASENFPVGTIVSGAAASVPGFGISIWRQAQTLASPLAAGTSYTALGCTSFLPGLSGTAQVGAQLMTIQPGALPVVSQRWTLTTAVNANAGLTSLAVSSQVAQATFPVGSIVGIWMSL